MVENLLNWTRDSQNRLMFTERIEKYAVFKNPQVRCGHTHAHTWNICKCFFFTPATCLLQNYLLGRKETCEMAERNKEALLEVGLFHHPFIMGSG